MGILCPVCKGEAKVIDSRKVAGGEICRRRYRCACRVSFTTYESVVGELSHADDPQPKSYKAGAMLGKVIREPDIYGA